MATDQNLVGWDARIDKGVAQGKDESGAPQQIAFWQITLTERGTGNRIRFRFDKEVRNFIVRELTGGVVLAGGEFPQV